MLLEVYNGVLYVAELLFIGTYNVVDMENDEMKDFKFHHCSTTCRAGRLSGSLPDKYMLLWDVDCHPRQKRDLTQAGPYFVPPKIVGK